jgi:hypothetical protein
MFNHDLIISKCEGCHHITKDEFSGKQICAYHAYPKFQWWGDFDCPSSTHIKHKFAEDPTEEGKYDNHKR